MGLAAGRRVLYSYPRFEYLGETNVTNWLIWCLDCFVLATSYARGLLRVVSLSRVLQVIVQGMAVAQIVRSGENDT